INAIGSGHELIAYDQRGSGRSAPLQFLNSWEQRGADLWSIADAAGIERAVLYGVFDAGFTIAQAAAQQPGRVLGMIFNLVPPAVGVLDPKEGITQTLADAWFGSSPLSARQRAESALQSIGLAARDAESLAIAWESAGPHVQGQQLLRRADLRPLTPCLGARSLVIEPQHRPAIAGWGASLAAMLPNAHLARPAGAGEMLGAIHGFLALIDLDEGHYASRLAADVSAAVGETEHAVTALKRIVVPVVDSVSSERAAEMACRLGRPQQAEIVLVHVVEVPLSRALAEESGPARERGEKALHLGQAIVARHGMRSRTRLLFERSATHGILRVAREEGADLIVMAIGEKRRPDPAEMSATMKEVLRSASCEVLIDKGQRART
ncbi:MAG TPA: universal stress protein, partial [Dehalococcoidia bacterium]|nr:universal stress protein [Dehalococcoidia bacterium]